MKTYVALLSCVLPSMALSGPLHAGVISELTAVTGPASPALPPPIPVSTSFVDNDEKPMMVNFFQLFTALPITGTNPQVDFIFLANDSGTGVTTEYLLNHWIMNDTGAPWPGIRYTLTAQTTSGAPIPAPGLDFDWPDKTAPFIGSTNYPNVTHLSNEMVWEGGSVGPGFSEITTFAIDVPDLGVDYHIVLRLEVLLRGDLSGDGFVGIDDLNLVLGNWNQNVPPAEPLADPTGDGFVGIEDLNEVLGNWNIGTPPSEAAGTVPEPASFLALSFGLLMLGRCRGRNTGD